MEKIYEITLRVSESYTSLPLFNAVQSDNVARKIKATLLNDDGSAFAPDSGTTAAYWSVKADRKGTEHAATISGNVVTVVLTEQDLAYPGRTYATIVLTKGDQVLSAIPFWFNIIPRAVGQNIASTSQYQVLQEAIENAEGAAENANSAADNANEAASHGPYIRESDLHWMIWDVATEKYVDSNVPASGAATGAVLFVQQTLTTNQKKQARTNIDAAGAADFESLKEEVDDIRENTGQKRYGVTGLTNRSPVLTRLYDAVGMIAQVGTDNASATVVNSFDNCTPFNRKKCVGDWHLIPGASGVHPVFSVRAYLEDEDFAEDGSMGDYVAVECPRAFYHMAGTELVISAHQYQGYRPFDIFCHGHDPEDTMPFCYLPAYALALNEEGHAVSLPGYDNEQGDYASLFQKARTYKNGELGKYAILQPAAVNFYEWALFTVEFATNNCQSIMQGCSSLRHNADDKVKFVDSTHIIFQNYQAARVAGEYIAVITTDTDINDSQRKATHRIVSIIRSDADGNASASGAYQYAEVEDLGKAYWDYDLTGATEYRVAARPYRTGACNDVVTPSGSPVSNTDGYHPMRYRYRENVYANQNKTTVDLFNTRVQDESGAYYLKWYYLTDPTQIETPSNPGTAAIKEEPYIELDISTPAEDYVNGYIKSKKYSAEFPDIWIPDKTTGASSSTYFCDYAYLVHSAAVRSVRFGGLWNSGAYFGLSFAIAHFAPSTASAASGGDLCIAQ